MENYVRNLRSGVVNPITASTLKEAKKEAIAQAAYDGGSLELCYNGVYYYADLKTYPGGEFCWVWVL